jgi:diadenosine tetraphosphate (Ap4A) HIT family hydrolase
VFRLHPVLEKDTIPVTSLPLSRVLLMNDARFPWLILVPQSADMREGVREIHKLSRADQAQLMTEAMQASEILEKLFVPDKINVGALGNLVPQLHVHVIARFKTDAAWPGPVWGHSQAVSYASDELERIRSSLTNAFG